MKVNGRTHVSFIYIGSGLVKKAWPRKFVRYRSYRFMKKESKRIEYASHADRSKFFFFFSKFSSLRISIDHRGRFFNSSYIFRPSVRRERFGSTFNSVGLSGMLFFSLWVSLLVKPGKAINEKWRVRQILIEHRKCWLTLTCWRRIVKNSFSEYACTYICLWKYTLKFTYIFIGVWSKVNEVCLYFTWSKINYFI